MHDLAQMVDTLAIGQDRVTVEEFGHSRAKVSGRCAHYIRDAVEDNTQLRIRRDINQHAFTVEWNA